MKRNLIGLFMTVMTLGSGLFAEAGALSFTLDQFLSASQPGVERFAVAPGLTTEGDYSRARVTAFEFVAAGQTFSVPATDLTRSFYPAAQALYYKIATTISVDGASRPAELQIIVFSLSYETGFSTPDPGGRISYQNEQGVDRYVDFAATIFRRRLSGLCRSGASSDYRAP